MFVLGLAVEVHKREPSLARGSPWWRFHAWCGILCGHSGGMSCRLEGRRGCEAAASNGDGGFDSAWSVRGCSRTDWWRRQLRRCPGTSPRVGAVRGCLVGDPGRPSRWWGVEVGAVGWTHRDISGRIRADELRPLLAGPGRDRKRLAGTRERPPIGASLRHLPMPSRRGPSRVVRSDRLLLIEREPEATPTRCSRHDSVPRHRVLWEAHTARGRHGTVRDRPRSGR